LGNGTECNRSIPSHSLRRLLFSVGKFIVRLNDTLTVIGQVTDAVRVLAASLTMYGISSEMLQSCVLVNTGQTWNMFRCIFTKEKLGV